MMAAEDASVEDDGAEDASVEDDGAEDASVEDDGAGISNFFGGSEDVAQEAQTTTDQTTTNAEDVAKRLKPPQTKQLPMLKM